MDLLYGRDFAIGNVAPAVFDFIDDPVPDPLARTAFRVVQEGLTNARKHAPGEPVTITIAALADAPTSAAAIYLDDIFVPLEESLATAAHLGDLRPWVTNEYQHNGIGENGAEVMGKLFALIDDH